MTGAIDVALLAIFEDSLIFCALLAFWAFVFGKLTHRLRSTRSGIAKDGSVYMGFTVTFLAIGSTILTFVIYLDYKREWAGSVLGHTWFF